MKTEGANN